MGRTGKAGVRNLRLPVALALAAGLAAGCGSELYGAVPAPVAAAAETTTRTEALLLDLHEQVNGTIEDRRAQEFAAYAATQGHLRSCMAAAEFAYNVPPFYDIYAGQARLPLPDTFLELPKASREHASAHGLHIGERVVAARQDAVDPAAIARSEKRTAAYKQLSASQQDAYGVQLTKCERSLPAGVEQTGLPPTKQALDDALRGTWQSAVEAPEVQTASAGYAGCMKEAGVAVESREHLLILVDGNYGPFKPDLDGSAPLELTHPQFTSAQQFEKQAAIADARCRQDAHQLAMTRLLPLLERFAADHASEIATVRQQWAETRAATEQLRSSSE